MHYITPYKKKICMKGKTEQQDTNNKSFKTKDLYTKQYFPQFYKT